MIPIFSLCHAHNWHCDHDDLMKNIDIIYTGEESQRKPLFKRYANWSQIRIKFDYDYIDGTKPDPKMCTQAGQVIEWKESYTCTEDTLLDKTKIDAIKATFENLKVFLENLLTVIPADHPYQIKNWSTWTSFQPKTVSDVDLHIAVVARPTSGMTIASAGSHVRRKIDNFPEQGVVFLNPIHAPTKPQNMNSDDSDYFYVLLHEVTHALGFTDSAFYSFHSYDNMTRYKEPICKLTKLGKNFTFLVTPFCHRWALKHYGVEKFYGDNGTECLSGIEIEDNGGSGTVGSHLEGRVFFSDYMLGTSIHYISRLTDASLAVLQDTGNFKCNYSLAQPLVWGHPESIDGNYIKHFATGPPQKVFPSGYLSINNNIVGFDYSFIGYNGISSDIDCSVQQEYHDYVKYCAGKELFYNPNNLAIGPSYLDFQLIISPSTMCPQGKSVLPSTTSWMAKCSTYECIGYDRLIWNYTNSSGKNEIFECNKTNIGMNFSDYTCPDPERFCRSVKLHDAHFKEDPFDLQTVVLTDAKRPPIPESGIKGDEEKPSKNNKKILIIGIVIACIVAIIIIVVSVFIYIKIKNSKNSGDEPETVAV